MQLLVAAVVAPGCLALDAAALGQKFMADLEAEVTKLVVHIDTLGPNATAIAATLAAIVLASVVFMSLSKPKRRKITGPPLPDDASLANVQLATSSHIQSLKGGKGTIVDVLQVRCAFEHGCEHRSVKHRSADGLSV
jgi:hypothetical protein